MFGMKFLLISRTLPRGRQKWTHWFDLSCQHVDWNLLSKSAFAQINTWMRFSNYAIQSQQIQVTFTFKKQNVRQTTYRNNSSNGCVTLNQINNTRIHSRKQLGSCWALTIVRFSHNVTNPRCIRLKKQNGRQNNRPTRSRTQDFKNTKILSV